MWLDKPVDPGNAGLIIPVSKGSPLEFELAAPPAVDGDFEPLFPVPEVTGVVELEPLDDEVVPGDELVDDEVVPLLLPDVDPICDPKN